MSGSSINSSIADPSLEQLDNNTELKDISTSKITINMDAAQSEEFPKSASGEIFHEGLSLFTVSVISATDDTDIAPFEAQTSEISLPRSGSLEYLTYAFKNVVVRTKPSFRFPDESFLEFLNPEPENPKFFLNNVFGIARPGEMIAIMGASGSGKTTLLNALTFRNPGNLLVFGDFLLNGTKISPYDIRAVSAYIQQDNIFIPTMTPREQLTFQSQLRMDSRITQWERKKRVNDVINYLGLKKCADVLIGAPGAIKGISGGERKKLALAAEILTDPRLMFCDEPTSGLDSYGALNMITNLKRLAREGRTILCTIHQPSSSVYALFDRVMFLAEGRVAFLGTPEQAVLFFSAVGFTTPPNYNPSDFFIDTLAIRPGAEKESQNLVATICDVFVRSDMVSQLKYEIDVLRTRWGSTKSELDRSTAILYKSPYKEGRLTQFKVLFRRTAKTYVRDTASLFFQTLQAVTLAVLIGTIFNDQNHDQIGVQNITGCLFLCLNLMSYQYCFSVIDKFILEQPVFFREHQDGMYRVDVFFLTRTLVGLPLFILWPTMFVSISYYMIGLSSNVFAFVMTIVIFILVANTGASFGFLISCFVPNITLGLVIGPALIIPLMLFGGFFINSGSTPSGLVWLHYISWFFYSNQALQTVQWQNVEIECPPNSTSCIPDGIAVLKNLDINPDNFDFNMCMLFVLFVVYRALAFLALLYKAYRRRR